MKIEIKTDSIDNIVKFRIDDEEFREFDYKSLDSVISKAMSNDDEIEYETGEKLEDYEMLIKKIVVEARSEDFKNAVQLIMNAKKEYEDSKDVSLEENQGELYD